jgi:hypothetical protein
MDTTKRGTTLSDLTPSAWWSDAGTGYKYAGIAFNSATTARMVVDGAAVPIALDTFDASDIVNFEFEYPVQGWSSDMVLSSSTSNREIVVRATRETSAQTLAVGDNEIIFNSVEKDTVNAYSTTTGRFTATEDGIYFASSTLTIANGATAPTNARYNFFKNANTSGTRYGAQYFASGNGAGGLVGTSAYGVNLIDIVYLKKNETLSVWNTNVGQASTLQSGFGQGIFSVQKIDLGKQTIGKEQVLFAKYRTSASNAVGTGATIVDFGTMVSNDGINVTTGASWKATFSRDGLLSIDGALLMSPVNLSTSQRFTASLYLNGSEYDLLDYVKGSGVSASHGLTLSTALKVKKDEYVDVRVKSSVSGNLDSGGSNNWISLKLE